MSGSLLLEQKKHILIVTLNRPDQRNAFDDEMIDGFEQMVEQVNRDQSIKVVIVTGAGSAFCAGGDIKQMRDKTGMFGGTTAEIRQQYRQGIQRVPRAMLRLEVPSIAAVNGAAVGAGCDLTFMCDIRIASSKAKFAESFVKLGLIPGDGGAWLLPRAIGYARAAEMSFTGDAVDADTAESWGLVSQQVEPDQLMPAAMALAERMTANSGAALRACKRLLQEGRLGTLDSMLDQAASMQAILHHTDEHEQAIQELTSGKS